MEEILNQYPGFCEPGTLCVKDAEMSGWELKVKHLVHLNRQLNQNPGVGSDLSDVLQCQYLNRHVLHFIL